MWFDHLPGGETAENLNVQSYEGRRDLTFWHGKVLSLGFGQGEDVVMNSHYQTVARVPGGNGLQADLHDFQIAPHGISYTTAFNAIRCNLSSVDGASDGVILDTAVQEIDMKTGLVRWEWHSLDHVGVSESETPAPKRRRPGTGFTSTRSTWSGNANQSGNIFISARSTWAGYQLEGGSGNILWRLGGLKSSFKMGPGTETAWQHDGRILSSGEVTFFDDGSNPPIHRQSRGLRIALDSRTHEAHLIAAYTHPDPPLLTPSQGNMQTLADGNAVVGYGGVPAISEFAPGGTLLFDAHLPFDMSFYRAFRFPWSGRPSTPPAVLANSNNTGEETIVHMSWNGASEVASWRVLAGERPGSLTARTTIPASAFESSTILPKKYAYAAVQALDAAGKHARQLKAGQGQHVRRRAAFRRTVGMSEMPSKPVLWSACAEPCPRCSSCRSSAWRSSCSLFYRRTLPLPAWPQGRPAALAWRPVTFVSSAGLLSSLVGLRRPPYQASTTPILT